MKSGKKNISEQDFNKYLAGEMTSSERNTFEKEIQKHSFEAEALEGFEAIRMTNIQRDLEELQKKMNSKKRKNIIPLFAAAATILLLIASGIIWMTVQQDTPLPKITENKNLDQKLAEEEDTNEKYSELSLRKQAIKKQEEDNAPQNYPLNKKPITESEESIENNRPLEIAEVNDDAFVEKDFEIEMDEDLVLNISDNNTKKREETGQTAPKTIIQKDEMKKGHFKNNKVQITKTEQPTKSEESKTVRGKIVSADDQMPIAGVTIVEKGTNNGIVTDINGEFQLQLEKDSNTTVVASFIGMVTSEFQPTNDSQVIALMPDDIALSEVVVVGYGSKKKAQALGATSTVIPEKMEASPVCGIKAYKNLLASRAILPENYPAKKVVVKLKLNIDELGNITEIENTNNVDKILLALAKEIIREAPEWNPKTENAKNIASTVKLKITFRKE